MIGKPNNDANDHDKDNRFIARTVVVEVVGVRVEAGRRKKERKKERENPCKN